MLPSASRMRHSDQFAGAVRGGKRAGRPTLVAHLSDRGNPADPPLVGFVVSRAVGGAVERNRVKRRLRHLMRHRLHCLPRGSLLVVRANPQAASARSEQLAAELDVALDRLIGRRTPSRRAGRPAATDGRS
ncbi:ribonuclease P protein component [Sphaerisporangium sp. TRM90804]|uniref:ribonuclease P protein component n=1 Tax=Sphaerisporangium sp. TRM90804 TaxID=3031113 RepID=UPI00244A94F1|nr:ribonuclease P protein component [Sphaerisporangium sp. TRM90804]MDH2425564.1 ribonuclease P protein component [Sphaerisporangium sp. TRM90804]